MSDLVRVPEGAGQGPIRGNGGTDPSSTWGIPLCVSTLMGGDVIGNVPHEVHLHAPMNKPW